MHSATFALALIITSAAVAQAAEPPRILHCVEQATTALAYHEDIGIWEPKSPALEEKPDFRLVLENINGGLKVTFVRYEDYPEECTSPDRSPIKPAADGTFACKTFQRFLVDPTNLTFVEEPDEILLIKKTILPQATLVAGRCQPMASSQG